MIKFTNLELHNYKSFLDATLSLENKGVVLIEGRNTSNNSYQSNAAGKSTLLSGITFALYGKTIEGASGDAVINSTVGKDCHVFLYFNKDGVDYRIERYRKGTKGNANKVRLYANDKEITASTLALTNAKIEELIGITFGTYANTISYGQGDEPVFSQATDKGKKEILENLANISIYEKAKDQAKEHAAEEQAKANQLSTEYHGLESKVTMLKQYESQAKEKGAQVAKQKTKDAEAIANINREINDLQSAITEAKQVFDKATQEYNAYKDTPVPTSTELSNQVTSMSSDYNNAKMSATILKRNIAKSLKDLKDATDATNCPLCGAPLDANHRAAEMARLTKEVKDQAAQYKEANGKAETIMPELTEAQNKLSSVDDAAKKIYSKKSSLQTRMHASEHDYVSKVDYAKNLVERRDGLKNRTYEVPDVDYSADIADIEKQMQELSDKQMTADGMLDAYQLLADKVFSRKGVPSMALDLVTPFLTEHTNHYLAKLSGSILKVSMTTQTLNANKSLSDKFDIQVFNDAGASSYQSCSTGEKKRIDIAIAFAIQDLQNSKSNLATNIAIYDECFDGLDAIGAETVIELLKEKAKTVGSIFVITHNDTLKPFFDSVITVEKGTDGISHMLGD